MIMERQKKDPGMILRMFPDLLTVGMELQVTVVPSKENEKATCVKTLGGCFGTLVSEYNFSVGTLITATVKEIVGWRPVFEPTQEWLLARTPQKGRVVFFTPRGVVVELAENVYAVYQPAEGLSEELQATLKEGREIEVCGLTKTGDGTYTAQTLKVPEAEKPQLEDPMAPWDEKKIAEVAKISAKVWGPFRLGKVIIVEVKDSETAQLSKGGMVTLKEGKFPRGIARAFVRVVNIDKTSKKVLVEFIKADNTKPEKPAFVAKAEDPTAVGYRNDAIVQKAKEMGSLWFAGPNQLYKLGFNYRVKMDSGIPAFEDKAYPAVTFNVIIDDRCQEHIADGEEVVCRVNHISRQGPTSFTFNVSILKVL